MWGAAAIPVQDVLGGFPIDLFLKLVGKNEKASALRLDLVHLQLEKE